MTRLPIRALLGALLLAAGLSAASAQGVPSLAAAFERLDPAQRRAVQEELSLGGYYAGAIDGRYGPGTEAALIEADGVLRAWKKPDLALDLDDPAALDRALSAIAAREASAWLYGEGEMCEDGMQDGC